MIAREINGRLESGQLRVVDGWEGIRSGMMLSRSISLSENSRATHPSTCFC